MWDSFAAGVALSSMRHGEADGGNDFAELEYMNITVVTSNRPYGVRDGSNPFFDGRAAPKFGLKNGGVHSGHVQTGIDDAFCMVPGSKRGRCEVLTYFMTLCGCLIDAHSGTMRLNKYPLYIFLFWVASV